MNGLAAVRSLGRAGRRWSPSTTAPGRSASDYALPVRSPTRADEEAFVSLLSELGDALGRPAAVFPTHDESLNAVARARERLGDRFRYPFPPWEALARIQSKGAARGRRGGGNRRAPDRPPALRGRGAVLGDELGYPVLASPPDPIEFKRRHRRQAFRCETRKELEDAFALAEPHEPMVQELVPEATRRCTRSELSRRDREAARRVQRAQAAQTPRLVGTCRVGEAVWVQEVVDAGLRLLAALDFRGLSQVEFKRDPRDGRYKLMEVNPRLFQWHGLAAACGVDLPRLAYCDLLGLPAPEAAMDGSGKRWAITFLAGERPALQRPPTSTRCSRATTSGRRSRTPRGSYGARSG